MDNSPEYIWHCIISKHISSVKDMPSLSDIPVDVLLDNLLPLVHVADLLHLSATSRFFAILGADETFWKRRLHNDFNFSGAGTARTTAWKTIYKGMSSPRIYTWGQVKAPPITCLKSDCLDLGRIGTEDLA